MPVTAPKRANHLLFRLHPTDSDAGVSRETLSRLAATLGIKETQVLQYAVRQLARAVFPAYDADEDSLSAKQLRVIREAAPNARRESIASSLF